MNQTGEITALSLAAAELYKILVARGCSDHRSGENLLNDNLAPEVDICEQCCEGPAGLRSGLGLLSSQLLRPCVLTI